MLTLCLFFTCGVLSEMVVREKSELEGLTGLNLYPEKQYDLGQKLTKF